jgi:hypothetical protein
MQQNRILDKVGSFSTAVMHSNWANSDIGIGNNKNTIQHIDGILAHYIHFCLGCIYKEPVLEMEPNDTTTGNPDEDASNTTFFGRGVFLWPVRDFGFSVVSILFFLSVFF